jgi:hypothetical protein
VRTKVLSAARGGAISGDNAVQIQLPALVSRAPFLEFQVYRPSGLTKSLGRYLPILFLSWLQFPQLSF